MFGEARETLLENEVSPALLGALCPLYAGLGRGRFGGFVVVDVAMGSEGVIGPAIEGLMRLSVNAEMVEGRELRTVGVVKSAVCIGDVSEIVGARNSNEVNRNAHLNSARSLGT